MNGKRVGKAGSELSAAAGNLLASMRGDIDASILEQLPMTPAYVRLILRHFGDSPDRRAAILEGTGLTEERLRDPAVEISLFQQIRQMENLVRLFGDGWAVRSPELWPPTVHGSLGVAAIAAPNFDAMMETIVRYGFVRVPYQSASLRRGQIWSQIEYELTVPLDEHLWRPLIEVTFIGVRAAIAAMLATPPLQLRFFFACAEPLHCHEVRAVLGEDVVYGAPRNAIRFPSAWLSLASPFADAKLHGVAIGELQNAARRITLPLNLRGRVERLLSTLPAGRFSADEVARRTGVSRRTLVRRLAQAGTSYRQLLDAELRSRAMRLLQDGHLSHARMAEELGFTDPTSVSRLYRRWFGGKPPA